MQISDGLELKIERIRRGLPQWRAAAAAGITQSVLCATENGGRPLSGQDADAIRRTIASLDGPARSPVSHERVD
ncbi:MAG: helix-turn-helix domain-containing protein [Chloroflexota bacterium]|nr:helix-turn-helix domain-containing protein [Chloroflexota bacterium]